MQIFFTHNCPRRSAIYLYRLDRRRANKQLLEAMQLFNNFCISKNLQQYRPVTVKGKRYEKRNFPLIFEQWLGESWSNIYWLYEFMSKLEDLFIKENKRYPKTTVPSLHKDNLKNIDKLLFDIPFYNSIFPQRSLTPFPNYAKSKSKGLDFTDTKNTLVAYRNYLTAQL